MVRWLIVVILCPGLALATGGRLNASGCHNSKTEGYHCHGSGSSGGASSTKASPSGPGVAVIEVYTLAFLSLSAGTDKEALNRSTRYASVVDGTVQAVDKVGRRTPLPVEEAQWRHAAENTTGPGHRRSSAQGVTDPAKAKKAAAARKTKGEE